MTQTRDHSASIFLQPGPQTLIDAEIQRTVARFQGKSTTEKTQEILSYLHQFQITRYDEKLFRTRTAAEIINQKLITGCTDATIAFVVLARASEIPSKYVETIDKEWLETGKRSISGHQYVQIYDYDYEKWIWIDPMGNRINTLPPEKEGRVIYKVGLDSWDIGIRNFDELEKKFKIFRIKWIIRHKISHLVSLLTFR